MRLLIIALVLIPQIVFASSPHGEGHAPATIDTLLWPAVNFSIFCFLISSFYRKLARPKLRDYRIELENNVVRQQNESTTLSSEYEQLRDRLGVISEEKQEIILELEKDGRDLSTMILSTANQEAEKASQQAKRRFSLETKKISGEAKTALMDRVIKKVSAQLSGSFSVEDDASFIKKSVEADLNKIFPQN